MIIKQKDSQILGEILSFLKSNRKLLLLPKELPYEYWPPPVSPSSSATTIKIASDPDFSYNDASLTYTVSVT